MLAAAEDEIQIQSTKARVISALQQGLRPRRSHSIGGLVAGPDGS